jgi:pyruvate kinase
LISKYRPRSPIFAFAASPAVCARLNLMWGVSPLDCEMTPDAEDMVMKAETLLLQLHAVQPGDVIAVVAGTRTSSGSTNFMRLHVVGTSEHTISRPEERRKIPRLRPGAVERRKR